jgi:hypothetical protein
VVLSRRCIIFTQAVFPDNQAPGVHQTCFSALYSYRSYEEEPKNRFVGSSSALQVLYHTDIRLVLHLECDDLHSQETSDTIFIDRFRLLHIFGRRPNVFHRLNCLPKHLLIVATSRLRVVVGSISSKSCHKRPASLIFSFHIGIAVDVERFLAT